jgi:hypothetical protein
MGPRVAIRYRELADVAGGIDAPDLAGHDLDEPDGVGAGGDRRSLDDP